MYGISNGISKAAESCTVMPLSDTAIKNAKPKPDKDYKLPDEKGMYLLIHKNGGD
jgi:hypothetical protein